MENKRKSSIVTRNLQYQILISVVGSGVAIYLISTLGLRILANRIFGALELAEVRSDVALNIVDDINHSALYLLILTSLCLIFTWISALYLSNRIAGPIYKINRVLDERLAGDKDVRIVIRKKDFFVDLVEKINLLLDEKPNSNSN